MLIGSCLFTKSLFAYSLIVIIINLVWFLECIMTLHGFCIVDWQNSWRIQAEESGHILFNVILEFFQRDNFPVWIAGLQAAILIWCLLNEKWECFPKKVKKQPTSTLCQHVKASSTTLNQILEIVDLIDFVHMLVCKKVLQKKGSKWWS